MQINVVGVLIDPTGNYLPEHTIRITDKSLSIDTYEYTDTSGVYNFALSEGNYFLEILFRDTYMLVGDLIVNDGTPSSINLEDLIEYSTPIELEDIEYPSHWQTILEDIDEGAFTSKRESIDQLTDELVHVLERKTTSIGENSDERKGTYDIDVKSCGSQVTKQSLVYSDVEGNYLASDANSVSTDTTNVSTTLILDTGISKVSLFNTVDYTSEESLTVTGTGSVASSSKDFQGNSEVKSFTLNGDSVSLNKTLTAGFGTLDSSEELSASEYVTEASVVSGDNSFTKISHTNTDGILESYTSNVGTKSTSDIYENDGVLSSRKITVDNMKIGSEVNDTFEVDTETNTVYVRGALRVSQLEDEDGNELIIEDGDTIFQVFQYASTLNGVYHDDQLETDYYKRENFSVNGVIDNNLWGLGYQFRSENIQGESGDTIYVEYQYSPDGVSSWTPTLEAGDAFRIERTVTNGVGGAWSEPSRIIGNDGDTIEIRSQYSVDGINNWHDTYAEGDNYERRARFVNGVIDSAWSDAVQLTGDAGIPGLNGSGWYVLEGHGGVWPGDTTATAEFITAFGRVPQLDDHLFYVDDGVNTTTSDGKRCITPVGEGTPVWSTPVSYIDGDMIVKGTMSADRVVGNFILGNTVNAQTSIIAGSGASTAGINGYDLPNLPTWIDPSEGANPYSGYRFWAGSSNPSTAPFSVDSDGKLKASNVEISGDITSSSGEIGGWNIDTDYIYSGTLQTNNDFSTSGITLFDGGALRSPNFRVDTDGSAYFKGDLSGASGTFSGTVYANNIEGDVTDTLVKVSTTIDHTAPNWTKIIEVDVTALPFERNIIFSGIYLSVTDGTEPSSGSVAIRIKGDGTIVGTTDYLQVGEDTLFPFVIATIPANEAHTYTLEPGTTTAGKDVEHQASQILIQAFKSGSTLS